MGKVTELVERAVELGQKAIAITDHGNMCHVLDLYKQCKKNDVQPIYGIEFYLRVEPYEKRFHLIAFAKTNEGLKTLYKLQELSSRQKYKGKPCITYNDLFAHNKDIIITTACIGGHIPWLIREGKFEEVYSTVEMLKTMFGDDLYLELQANTLPEQAIVNKQLLDLAKLYKIKPILTSDTHYVLKHDAIVHEMLLCMQTQDKMNNPERFKFPSQDYWLRSEEEMISCAIGVKSIEDIMYCINNTDEIADKCKFELELPKPEDALPKYSEDEKSALRKLCNVGWRSKKHGKGSKEQDRTNYELSVIEQKGYSGYFLIVADYINWAKSNNVLVGGGRGSCAGSMVSYLTGISALNPIEHGLLFERFLNPERMSSPD